MVHENPGPSSDSCDGSRCDAVILGGGLAGLLLARQLRRELPELSVTVLERTRRPLPEACHKVGESSVELGSQYLEKLDLGPYLQEAHLLKLGLRFFPGGGELPLHERTEIGPSAEPVVRSYQIDRGLFENDMRAFVEEDGARLLEGAKVTEVELVTDRDSQADHTVRYEQDGESQTIAARWVIDATGRAAVLRRKLKQTRGLQHKANAGWFRVEGKLDLNDMVPRSEVEWFERPLQDERWRSTNHFMGAGYWAWLIPLSTNHTSVGLVVHDHVHGHECISSYESMMAFLREHEPHLAAYLEGHAAKDYLCLRNYSNSVGRAWSPERWAMVGEAGAFVDPLYSPGTDFVGLANSFTTQMLLEDQRGGDLDAKATQMCHLYRAMVIGTVDLFRRAAPIYGHPRAMATKIYWDNFSYWSFTCQFAKQELFREDADGYAPYGVIGQRFLELGNHMQELLTAWAELLPAAQEAKFVGAPHFPSVLVDAHMAVGDTMDRAELLAYMQLRQGQMEEIAGELVLRIVQELGPELGAQALERARFPAWGITIAPERIEAERHIGYARRKMLSVIARDVERTLGRVPFHERVDEARELLALSVPS